MHLVRSGLFGLFLQKVRVTRPNSDRFAPFWTSCARSTVSGVSFIQVSRLLIFHHHAIEVIKRSSIGGGYRIFDAVESNGHGAGLAHVALGVGHTSGATKVRKLALGVFATGLIKTVYGAARVARRVKFLYGRLALMSLPWLRLSLIFSSFLMLVMNNLWHLIAVKLYLNL